MLLLELCCTCLISASCNTVRCLFFRSAGLNTYQIDTNDLPKGMYICHLIANKTAVAKKVVK
ncbi:MAG TPA: T9SS type A sorting domain-containing protein [Chitinophagales bacterium]|nr:T9SS type A sorting domain-containing protein [Chitinophagales bacterium]